MPRRRPCRDISVAPGQVDRNVGTRHTPMRRLPTSTHGCTAGNLTAHTPLPLPTLVSSDGHRDLIHPAATTLVHQVFRHLRERPDSPNRPSGSIAEREGVGAASTLRHRNIPCANHSLAKTMTVKPAVVRSRHAAPPRDLSCKCRATHPPARRYTSGASQALAIPPFSAARRPAYPLLMGIPRPPPTSAGKDYQPCHHHRRRQSPVAKLALFPRRDRSQIRQAQACLPWRTTPSR
jgi:hypothetical protein